MDLRFDSMWEYSLHESSSLVYPCGEWDVFRTQFPPSLLAFDTQKIFPSPAEIVVTKPRTHTIWKCLHSIRLKWSLMFQLSIPLKWSLISPNIFVNHRFGTMWGVGSIWDIQGMASPTLKVILILRFATRTETTIFTLGHITWNSSPHPIHAPKIYVRLDLGPKNAGSRDVLFKTLGAWFCPHSFLSSSSYYTLELKPN